MAGLQPTRRTRRGTALAACAAALVVGGGSSFLLPASSQSRATGATALRAGSRWADAVGGQEEQPSSLRQVVGVTGALSMAAALVLALAPQPALADDKADAASLAAAPAPSTNRAKASKYAKSRAKILEDAAQGAKERATDLAKDAQNKETAVNAFENLEKSQQAIEAKKETAAKKNSKVREQVLQDMEKKTAAEAPKETTGGSEPKAQMLFRQFFQQQEKKEEISKAKYQKLDNVRSSILEDLRKKKEEAKQVAREAEESALKLEELAKQARITAQETKRLADQV